MTEDDTFRRLKRIPFSEMVTIYGDWLQKERFVTHQEFEIFRNILFSENEWTFEEFRKERQKVLDERQKEYDRG